MAEKRRQDPDIHEPLTIKPIAGGMRLNAEQQLLEDGESPNLVNIEVDRGAIETSPGTRKWNNQAAPNAGLLFRVDRNLTPLYIESGKAVPMRGYAVLPYQEEHDIGGAFDFEGAFPASDTFHNRRGRSFEINVSFELPLYERLFSEDTKGTGAPTTPDANFNPFHGFDEALDDCHVIIQKGGDRTSPMSWALAVVNIGKMALGDATDSTAPTSRVSNYALCFMWYDAPQWGELAPAGMRYSLSSGVTPGAAGDYSTQALRAIQFHKFVEPGRRYSVALQLQIDSGTPGGVASATAWVHDGYIKLWVSEDGKTPELASSFIDSSGGGTTTGMDHYKGPQDSIRYLAKYGIRYAGRDAMFWGLGMRSHPWQTCGFIPWGADAAPLSNGGWRMIDRSSTTVAGLYGVGVHTLTCYKNANPDAFIRVNHAGLSNGNTNGGVDPMATHNGAAYGLWNGLSAGSGNPFNSEALRHYRLVTTADFTPGTPDSKGAIFDILSYAENAGNHEVTILGGSSINAFGAPGAQFPILVQAFRWNQRDMLSCELRLWNSPRAYDSTDAIPAARRKLSLRGSIDLNDTTEPDISTLVAYWRADDAGGQVVREHVIGGRRNGFLAPFGIGVSDGGVRGPNQVFLSGEGEALHLDLSENPIAKREIEAMLGGSSQGFAVEITCVFPEAMYAIMSPTTAEGLPDSALSGNRPRFVPDIVSWDVKAPSTSGMGSTPKPILSLTYRGLRSDNANGAQFLRPAGFSAEFELHSDQHNIGPIVHSDLLPWYLSGGVNVSRFDLNAGWVGKTVTIQVGIQSTGVADTYKLYIAMRPKQDFNPATGDPGDAEFAHVTTGGTTYDFSGTYYQAATVRIEKKDLARSVINIGGRWNPSGLGYSALNCRMILDEVRIYGASAAGSLPSTNGGVLTNRDGKLEGLRCMPARELTEDDILQPLGRNLERCDVTERSTTVTASTGGRFFVDEPRDTAESVVGAYLLPKGDVFDVPRPESPGFDQNEFYRVNSVAADGSSVTLNTPVNDATRRATGAGVFRLLGYTAFSDDLGKRKLPIAYGKAYNPASSTTADVLVTEALWANLAPISVDFRMRIYGPGAADILPRWSRGLVPPRRSGDKDGILGISALADAVYAIARGSVFQADDRWRSDGPATGIRKSLAFRCLEEPPVSDVAFPLEQDRVEFSEYHGCLFQPDPAHAQFQRYDAWVQPDAPAQYQTILWVGNPNTDPQKTAGTHLVHCIMRLNRLRPEFVFGSTASSTAGVPEKGLWIATASVALPVGQRSHVRWVFPTRDSGGTSVLKKPSCFVNGKLVAVRVNAVENHASITASDDWMRTSLIVQPGLLGMTALGAARDSYRAPAAATTTSASGPQLLPQRVQGWIHGLCGRLAELVVSTQASFSGSPPNFNPEDLTYSDTLNFTFRVLGTEGEGVGHHVKDRAGFLYGVIRSHPFISVFHELGRSDDMASFARFGQQLYAVNGERIVLVNGLKGAFAGVLPPLAEPTFSLERFPLWSQNSRSSNNADNSPVVGAATGVATQINHLKTSGNNYLLQSVSGADATAMAWLSNGFIHIKLYWKPVSIAGRISIWRKSVSKESGGPFLECRDGDLYFGWYDTFQKREVYVRTTGPVFKAGELHYIYVRKRWPQGDAIEGNWEDSIFTDGRLRRVPFSAVVAASNFQVGETVRWPGAGGANRGIVTKSYGVNALVVEILKTDNGAGAIPPDPILADHIVGMVSGADGTTGATAGVIRPMKDSIVVRRFPRSAPTNLKDNPLDALISGAALSSPTSRNCITFTVQNGPTGCTATGMVTPNQCTFTGAPAGLVNTGVSNGAPVQAWAQALAGNGIFHPDMVGMFFQFATGTFAGQVFRITTYTNGNQINVARLDGTVPDLTGPINVVGGVFTGIGIQKSSGFDTSRLPDSSAVDIHFLGTALQSNPNNGFAPHEAECWTPGWGVTTPGTAGTDARCFEDLDSSKAGAAGTDPIQIGTDKFPNHNYDTATGTGPQALRFDNGKQFYCTDGQTFTSAGWASDITTQPNTNLEVLVDPHTTNTAPTCTATLVAATKPTWKLVQDKTVWAGTRYFAVAFFDTDQGVVSNPSPVLKVVPAAEDSQNPSGAVRALLKTLPAARDTGNFEVWVFASASNGSAATLFRVARIANLTAETAVQALESVIGDGLPLEFDNGEPPECRVIAISNGRLFAAALTALGQLDGILASKVGSPAQFPYSGLARVNTGSEDAITGLLELDGLLLTMKREGVFSITLSSAGELSVGVVTSGAGCVAHQSLLAIDDRAVWRGPRGLYHGARGSSASNLAVVRLLSLKMDDYFRDTLDKAAADRSSAAVNARRDAYVVTARVNGEHYTRERIGALGDVFTRYRDPNITALASVRDPDGGAMVLVGGTQEGYLVWFERDDTQLVLMGSNEEDSGSSEILIATLVASTTTAIIVGSGFVDRDLDGLRGVPVRWRVSGVDYQATILGTEGGILHLDRPITVIPTGGDDATVGAQEHVWETKFFDFTAFQTRKAVSYLDLELAPGGEGQIQVELFSDRDLTSVRKTFSEQPVNGRKLQIPISMQARHVKARISAQPLTAGGRWGITGITWRFGHADQVP